MNRRISIVAFVTVLQPYYFGWSQSYRIRPIELIEPFPAGDRANVFTSVPSPTSSEHFVSFIGQEQAKWAPVVAATGAKMEWV